MPTLINQGKIEISVQDHVSSSMNDSGTGEKIDAPLTHSGSRDVLRRELILMRNKHGATSPIGARCSNIVELIQVPEVPKFQIERQMADLQRLLHDVQ